MTNQRLAFIDALRGFAILGVIIAHAASVIGLQGRWSILSLGGNGVELFFVVSAFTIFLTYERAKTRETGPVRNFFIRRMLRIVPVYWFGIILYTAVYGLGSRGWRDAPELWHYPYHITLMNVLHPLTSSSVVPGGWSISVEILFYLTVPLWFLLVSSLRSAVLFTIACVILGPISVWALQQVISFPAATPKEMVDYWHRIFLNQMAVFSFGILLFHLIKSGKAEWFKPKWRNLALLGAAAFVFLFGWQVHLILPRHYYFAASFMMVGLALSQIQWKIAVNTFTMFVGRISYSGYLLHFLVLKQLTLALPRGTTPSPLYTLLITALGIALTIPLAWLSFRYIETTFMNIGKAWIKRLERHPIDPVPTGEASGL